MTNGSVALSGMTDEGLVIVIEAKRKHEGKITFNPQQIQPIQNPAPNRATGQYNNVIVGWNTPEGFKGVLEMLHRLAPEEVKQS